MADKLSESMLNPILEQIGLLFNDHSHTENRERDEVMTRKKQHRMEFAENMWITHKNSANNNIGFCVFS